MRWYLSDRNRMAEVEAVVVENNVAAYVLERAKVDSQGRAVRRADGGLSRRCPNGQEAVPVRPCRPIIRPDMSNIQESKNDS